MQISHNVSGLNVHLTNEDKDQLTKKGKNSSIHVVLSPRSVENFIQVSTTSDLPNSKPLPIYPYNSASHPWVFKMGNTKTWPGVSALPMFSPEPVTFKITNTHNGLVFEIHRPPMTRASNAGRKMPVFKKRVEELLPTPPVNSGGLPLVEPSVDKTLLSEASSTLNLRSAIIVINDAKDQHGDNMIIEVMPNGKVRVLLDMGG
jgi:hypothetical protein